MKKFEYLTVNGIDIGSNGLNKYGEEGWELVNVVHYPKIDYLGYVRLPHTIFYFKREKKEDSGRDVEAYKEVK